VKIEAVDAFYLRMPDVQDIGDGSQDALLIRIQAGGYEGWGECEAAPLPTIAALIAPMSHSACKGVLDSVLNQAINTPQDIQQIHNQVRTNGMDLLQTDHALSGIDIALWDLLGKKEQAPVWSFFTHQPKPKKAYASQLFKDTPQETYQAAKNINPNFKAAKFGWGPIGRKTLEDDIDQFRAAREGLGPDRDLLIDTGCIFDHNLEAAFQRIPTLEEIKTTWWEEPFATGALAEYAALAQQTKIKLAAGEGAHNADQARHLIDYAKVGFIQIDTGRIGGITPARQIAIYCRQKAKYVNHTFTSNLALSASLQPYADQDGYAEIPIQTSALAQAIAGPPTLPDPHGLIYPNTQPGLGHTPNLQTLSAYNQPVEILINGQKLWPLR
jgi:L-alanine-DL-glutamate epimerase-like enolase superfamily enzyme